MLRDVLFHPLQNALAVREGACRSERFASVGRRCREIQRSGLLEPEVVDRLEFLVGVLHPRHLAEHETTSRADRVDVGSEVDESARDACVVVDPVLDLPEQDMKFGVPLGIRCPGSCALVEQSPRRCVLGVEVMVREHVHQP